MTLKCENQAKSTETRRTSAESLDTELFVALASERIDGAAEDPPVGWLVTVVTATEPGCTVTTLPDASVVTPETGCSRGLGAFVTTEVVETNTPFSSVVTSTMPLAVVVLPSVPVVVTMVVAWEHSTQSSRVLVDTLPSELVTTSTIPVWVVGLPSLVVG